MAEYKQVRLNPEVRELLDDYKMNGESYSIAIGRLFKENQLLRESQDRLMKMAMRTEDSIALPTVNHQTYFAIMELMQMENSDDDKLKNLKIYLRPSLMENPSQVYSNVLSIKKDFPEFSPILDKLSSWIEETFKL